MHYQSLCFKHHISVISISVFFLLFSFFSPSYYVHGEENAGRDALLRLLPSKSDLKEWKPDGTPEIAVGQELYRLINGGAEIYMQEGFERSIMASYSKGEGKVINLEVYEMTSPENAKKIQMKKIGKQGQKLPIGDGAVFEDYFLNFLKGNFQITLSGYDSDAETVKMILDLAHIVAKRIDSVH